MLLEYFPEVFLTTCIITQLNFNAWFRNQDSNFRISTNEVGGIQIIFILSVLLLLYSLMPEIVYNSIPFLDTEMLLPFKRLIIVLAIIAFISAYESFKMQKLSLFEYFTVFLLSMVSFLLIVNSNDLLSFYVLMEMQALTFYVLAAFNRTSYYSVSSGLKYFIFGSFISGIYLLGCSLIYTVLGTLHLKEISVLLLVPISHYNSFSFYCLSGGVILIFITLLFKIGIFPFYFWIPDIYEGAPLASTIFFSLLPKLPLYFFFVKYFNSIQAIEFLPIYKSTLIVLGLMTVFGGTFYALTQRRLKRMLVYSSIAQNGFIILCFGLQTVESISNLYFFLIIYLLSSFVIWTLVALLLSSSTKTSDFFELAPYPLYIDSMTSMAKRNAFFSFIATVVFFSLAGIPPVVGFLAKMNVVFELVNNDYLHASLLLLILSAVSVYYYIRTIKISFFEPSQSSDDHFFGTYSSDFDQPTYFSLSLVLLLLIATFLFPTYLLMFSHLIALL